MVTSSPMTRVATGCCETASLVARGRSDRLRRPRLHRPSRSADRRHGPPRDSRARQHPLPRRCGGRAAGSSPTAAGVTSSRPASSTTTPRPEASRNLPARQDPWIGGRFALVEMLRNGCTTVVDIGMAAEDALRPSPANWGCARTAARPTSPMTTVVGEAGRARSTSSTRRPDCARSTVRRTSSARHRGAHGGPHPRDALSLPGRDV